jgi:hypothetical protein
MLWTLYRRYAYHAGIPLWWDLYVDTWEWGLPLRVKIRPRLTDGSGRKERVTVVELSLLCLHWDVHYAWGKRRYRPPAAPILSLKEVLERDRAEGLTPGRGATQNDA